MIPSHIYANGDSWAYGNGIDEDPVLSKLGLQPPLGDETRLNLSWPAELGRLMNCNVKNESLGGGSNARIVRNTCDFLQKYPHEGYKDLLVVIGWTTIERDEIYLNHGGFSDFYKFNSAQKFSDQFVISSLTSDKKQYAKTIDEYQKLYQVWIQNRKMQMSAFFQQVFLLQNTLENLKINYIFFNTTPWHWVQGDDQIQFEIKLKDFIDIRFIGSSSYETMTSFINDGNYPMSSCLHPMVAGHAAWAAKLYKDINRIYLNDKDSI